jgi:predicted Rossmann-fold nucleotide-binding protein
MHMVGPQKIDQEMDGYRAEVAAELAAFQQLFAIQYIVSISGDAEDDDRVDTTGLLAQLIEGLAGQPWALLSGGTEGGIPEASVRIARANHVPTIGVFPLNGEKYALRDQLDLAIRTPAPAIGAATFGTETPVFAQLPNYAVFIGGSFGTLVELATILKVNKGRIEKAQPPIYILPLKGTGGITTLPDILRGINKKAKMVIDLSLPTEPFETGAKAAQFILEKEHLKHAQNT